MRRIVAFLDVLGFKQLVRAVPHADLVTLYRELQMAAHEGTSTRVYPEDHRRFDSDPHYEEHEIGLRRTVNVVMASDSIVVFSSGEGYEDARSVLTAVRVLLTAGLSRGLPLRGGVAVGELDLIATPQADAADGGLIGRFGGLVGLGLVRAYETEATCQWSGAVLHDELVAHLEGEEVDTAEDGTFTGWMGVRASRLVVPTMAPVKQRHGKTTVVPEQRWAVAWPLFVGGIYPELSEGQVAAAFTSYGRSDLMPGVVEKRTATLAFMRSAADDERAVPR
ncbi:MAG: hypothetical protein JWQ48_1938 [Conexibacter sp.]|nr:hypothetical protein [Conexibacter sp.]